MVAGKVPKSDPPFRFLRPEEFAALTQQERIDYLKQAIQAVTTGRPLLEGIPPKEPQ